MPVSLFPSVPITDALQIARVVADKNAGQPMRRLDIFQELGKSPESGPSRSLITASSTYGLTTGGYTAEHLSLTPLGVRATINDDARALIDAVLRVDAFRKFFDTYKGSSLPSEVASRSFLASNGIPDERTNACLEILLTSGRSVGLLAQISGAERVLSPEHAKERLGAPVNQSPATPSQEHIPAHEPSDAARHVGLPSFNVNLEIHLPPDASPETYEAIFTSMRKHLIDVGQ